MRVRESRDELFVAADLTVIVPCRNEQESVGPLLRAIRQQLFGRAIAVVFVDDSDDDTVAAIESEAANAVFPRVQVIHRVPGQRAGGLGSAVAMGVRSAASPYVAVMDADLQHPPAVLGQMLDLAGETGADVVVASRYVNGGRAPGLSLARSVGSWVAGRLARSMFPRRLASVTDPMSGFFLFRSDAVPFERLEPDGFKILLEVLVRTPDLTVVEVPYSFDARVAGQSKASASEARRYLKALVRLRFRAENDPPLAPVEIARAEVLSQ